jgi:hypothetical protein
MAEAITRSAVISHFTTINIICHINLCVNLRWLLFKYRRPLKSELKQYQLNKKECNTHGNFFLHLSFSNEIYFLDCAINHQGKLQQRQLTKVYFEHGIHIVFSSVTINCTARGRERFIREK